MKCLHFGGDMEVCGFWVTIQDSSPLADTSCVNLLSPLHTARLQQSQMFEIPDRFRLQCLRMLGTAVDMIVIGCHVVMLMLGSIDECR